MKNETKAWLSMWLIIPVTIAAVPVLLYVRGAGPVVNLIAFLAWGLLFLGLIVCAILFRIAANGEASR